MRKIILVIIINLVCLASCQHPQSLESKQLANDLYNLLDNENYFELKSKFDRQVSILPEDIRLAYEALVDHYFNKHAQSNKLIDKLLALDNNSLSDTLMEKLYQAKRMNHINLYEYSDAVKASDVLINTYPNLSDSSELRDLKNEHKIWLALSDSPKQEVVINSDSEIRLKRDKVGLMNITTVTGKDTVDFIFDTGANFSAIKRSLAEQLKLDIIDADFYVTAATGTEVACDLAVASEIQISNLIVKNAVFLILEDSDISFPQIEYFPNGAIGFPIIQALGELHFKGDEQIFIPKIRTKKDYNNLALDALTPVIAVKYEDDTLLFSFDTGAKSTTLYLLFYEKYQNFIDSNFTKETFKSGSAGGVLEFNGFTIDSLTFSIANSTAKLDDLRLHIEQVGDNKQYVHGNLGQDYIKQFDEMVISFTNSYITFE